MPPWMIPFLSFSSGAIVCGFSFLAWYWRSQRSAKSGLREKSEKVQHVINSVPGFVVCLDPDLQWVESSIGTETLFAENPPFENETRAFLNSTEISWTHEVQLTLSGHRGWYLISMCKSTTLSGHLVVVGIPICEQMKMRETLKNQRGHAEYAARMTSLGEMAGGMAHEINNPLTVIQGNASYLLRILEKENLEEHRQTLTEKIQKISQTSHRITKIVQGLRQFSRASDEDPMVPASLQKVIEDTLELCRERFRRAQVELICAPVPTAMSLLKTAQISQVILNLLNNAFDAVVDEPVKKIEIQFVKNFDTVCIFISDSGPGIDRALAQKIFQPFFTTKEVGKGIGLGLSISKSVIEDHKGELKIVWDAPQTTFQINLPLLREESTSKSA